MKHIENYYEQQKAHFMMAFQEIMKLKIIQIQHTFINLFLQILIKKTSLKKI